MDPGSEMNFEMAIRSVFGDGAYHIAEQATTFKGRKPWYVKAVKKWISAINELDTGHEHKRLLSLLAEDALACIENT